METFVLSAATNPNSHLFIGPYNWFIKEDIKFLIYSFTFYPGTPIKQLYIIHSPIKSKFYSLFMQPWCCLSSLFKSWNDPFLLIAWSAQSMCCKCLSACQTLTHLSNGLNYYSFSVLRSIAAAIISNLTPNISEL